MHLIFYNAQWMSWNIFLALVSVSLGYLTLKIKPKLLKALFILIFILFIPNTIYIATDLAHLILRWSEAETWVKAVISLQYLILIPIGFLTFIISIRLLQRNLYSLDRRLRNKWIMILLNFVIAFGVVIGRVQRANSWHIFTQPDLIVKNVVATFLSVELMLYIFLLGFFCSLLYLGVSKSGVGERT